MPTPRPKLVGVVEDLFFTVQIMDAAKRAGWDAVFVAGEPALIAQVLTQPALFIFDLTLKSLDAVRVIGELKAAESTRRLPIVAFLPHVQVEMKDRAIAAGADIVLPRSKFASSLPAILQSNGAAPAPHPEPE